MNIYLEDSLSLVLLQLLCIWILEIFDYIHRFSLDEENGVGNGFTAYEDGIQIGADLDITTADPKTSGNGLVYIGKRNPGDADYYSSASVDEIKMYNRQLTQQEICDMY